MGCGSGGSKELCIRLVYIYPEGKGQISGENKACSVTAVQKKIPTTWPLHILLRNFLICYCDIYCMMLEIMVSIPTRLQGICSDRLQLTLPFIV